MSLAGIFAVVNVLPLPVWAIWMIAPRSAAARHLAVIENDARVRSRAGDRGRTGDEVWYRGAVR